MLRTPEQRGIAASLKASVLAHRLSVRGSTYLDLLRGLSALLVMVGHLRGLFFVPFNSVENPGFVAKVFYFLTSLGHEAVVVFFILSGYFIAGSVMRALIDGAWQWRAYMTRRLTRLYLVLLPALVNGGLIDLAGIELFGTSGLYWADPDYRNIVPHVVFDRLNFQVLAANALFLEEILAPTFGSNGPLWSLSYEFWFYIMFPCAALALAAGSSLLTRLVFAALFIAISFFVGPVIFSYFFIWLLGACVVIVPPIKLGRAANMLVAGVALALALALLAARGKIAASPFVFDAALGIVVAVLVYALANWPAAQTGDNAGAGRLAIFSRGLAGFSYTLYLVHLPLLIFIAAAVIARGGARWPFDLAHGAAGLAIMLGAIGYACGVSRFTEAHTGRVAAYLLGRSSKR